MIVRRFLERAAATPPPPAPPPGGAAGVELLWWSRPSDGAFNVVASDGGGVLGFPVISRGVSLIADTIAAAPRHVYRGDDLVATPTWIADPGGTYTAPGGEAPGTLTPVDFYSQLLVSAVLWGNSYVWIDPLRAADGAPTVPLHIIHPGQVTVEHAGDVVSGYRVGNELLAPRDVLHVRGRTLPGSPVGIGVIALHRAEVEGWHTLRDYGQNTYGIGVPSGILRSEAPDLTQAEADRLKQAWLAAHGSGSRSIAVLNATTTFTPLAIPPADAQYLEAKKLSMLEQALIVGVPPNMVGAPTGDSMTYSNVESRLLELSRFTLLPWARRVEDALERYLPRGQKCRFVLDGLMRADTKTRYEAHAIALEHGWLTIDEVRALENLPPLNSVPVAEVTS